MKQFRTNLKLKKLAKVRTEHISLYPYYHPWDFRDFRSHKVCIKNST